MESLSKSLLPYKDVVATAASIVTIGQFFSGAFVCKDIYKKGSTKGVPATPFIGGIVLGILTLKYGLLLNDAAMLTVNIVAIILNVIYTIFYYNYSENKQAEIFKPLSIGAAIVAVFLGYAQIESGQNIEYRYGLILTILMLMLIGSPLLDVNRIIATKDASSIPLPLTLSGTVVTFLWFLYGVILMNQFMIFQNLIGFTLCVIQLVLVQLYPGPPASAQQSKKKKQ